MRTIIVDSEKQRQNYRDSKLANVFRALDMDGGNTNASSSNASAAHPRATTAMPKASAKIAHPPPPQDDGNDLLDLMDGL